MEFLRKKTAFRCACSLHFISPIHVLDQTVGIIVVLSVFLTPVNRYNCFKAIYAILNWSFLTPLMPTARTPKPRCSLPRNWPCGLPPWQPWGEPCAEPAAPGLWTAPYLHRRYLHDYRHAKCHYLEWHSPQDLNMGRAPLVCMLLTLTEFHYDWIW